MTVPLSIAAKSSVVPGSRVLALSQSVPIMSARSKSRGRSRSPARASALSPKHAQDGAIDVLDKGKEKNRVQYLVSLAGAEPAW